MVEEEGKDESGVHEPEEGTDASIKPSDLLDAYATISAGDILEKQVSYLLRKWAALMISNADADIYDESKPSEPIRLIPTGLGKIRREGEEDEDEEGGGGLGQEWMIYDDGDRLATTRPDLFCENAGLYEFMQVLDKMIEIVIERGWENICFYGYGADMAWVAVNAHNLKRGEMAVNVVNHTPADADFVRYEKILNEVVLHIESLKPE